jgi:hypothetical protein
MTKHRTSKRRSQKGGSWYNPVSWFGSSAPEDPNAPKKSVLDSITGATSSVVSGANNLLGSAAESTKSGFNSVVSGASGLLNTNVTGSSSTVTPVVTQPTTGATMGGRRRRRARTMKGGKDGLGLTYYASPVSGLKVAEPTYWVNSNTNQSIKGGSKSKRSDTKRRKSSRKSRKSRRNRKH